MGLLIRVAPFFNSDMVVHKGILKGGVCSTMMAIPEENVDRNVEEKDDGHGGRQREDLDNTVTEVGPGADDKIRLLEPGLDGEEESPVPWLHRLSPYITSMSPTFGAFLVNLP